MLALRVFMWLWCGTEQREKGVCYRSRRLIFMLDSILDDLFGDLDAVDRGGDDAAGVTGAFAAGI